MKSSTALWVVSLYYLLSDSRLAIGIYWNLNGNPGTGRFRGNVGRFRATARRDELHHCRDLRAARPQLIAGGFCFCHYRRACWSGSTIGRIMSWITLDWACQLPSQKN